MLRLGMFIDGPFIPSYEGATRRFVALARHLSALGAEITVFHCFRGWSNEDLIAAEPFRTYFILPRRFYHDPGLFERLIRRHGIAAAMMSTAESILSLGMSLKTHLPELRLYLEAHDVGTDYCRSLGNADLDVERMLSVERTAWAMCDLIICFTERDRERIRFLATNPKGTCAETFHPSSETANHYNNVEERIVCLPFGCDFTGYRHIGPSPNAKTVVFLGNLFHAPNALAVDFLAKRVCPRLSQVDPEVKILVAGDVPDTLMQRYEGTPLRLLGKVDDLGALFSETSLAVAPIFHGSGIKVKVLDYSMAALPTLCTSQAIAGIALTPAAADAFAIEDDPDAYPERIQQLMGQPQRLKELGEAAYRIALAHDWSSIAGMTLDVLERFQSIAVRPVEITAEAADSEPPLVPYYLRDNISQYRYLSDPEVPLESVLCGGWGKLEPVADADL